MTDTPKPSKVEAIKEKSGYLAGNLAEEMADASTDTVTDAAYELLKFHGSYFGYDRDTATERKKAGLDKLYEFMVRVKMPGGRLTADQYLVLDDLAEKYANGTLRLTTRETFQFHCIVKKDMKPIIAGINQTLLSTLGGCGDVVRNVMTCPAPVKDAIHAKLEEDTFVLAKDMAPKTSAYHEIWLDGKNVARTDAGDDYEPLYGKFYLPRKFKIGISTPEDNCIDVLTHDLAIISLFDGDELKGYNFMLGGGLGMTHNKPATYPRLASPIAFVPKDALVPATEAVIKLQRDHGDRSDRKHARLKYVVEEKGLDWTRSTLEQYFGRAMDDPLAMPNFAVEDHMGWHEQGDGKWFLGIPVSSGRIVDREEEQIRTGLREVIQTYKMPLRLTADQNILLCDIEEGEKPAIEALLKKHGIKLVEDVSNMYRNFLACVALPTCGKALAEAERVKLPLVADLEKVMDKHGILDEKIAIRMVGCPNGCARPYVGDIGIVGRMPGHYALFIGGDFEGTRLSEKIFDKIPFEHLPEVCDAMFAKYAAEKNEAEGFGDFCHRVGVDTVLAQVKNTLAPKDYKWAA